jgi:hypothetical protein
MSPAFFAEAGRFATVKSAIIDKPMRGAKPMEGAGCALGHFMTDDSSLGRSRHLYDMLRFRRKVTLRSMLHGDID